MAGAFDHAYCRVGPNGFKRMRGRRRTQEIVAALYDQAGDWIKLSCFRQKLARPHEAIVLEIMRLHERRRGQGRCKVQRSKIEPDTPWAMFGKDPFGVV